MYGNCLDSKGQNQQVNGEKIGERIGDVLDSWRLKIDDDPKKHRCVWEKYVSGELWLLCVFVFVQTGRRRDGWAGCLSDQDIGVRWFQEFEKMESMKN